MSVSEKKRSGSGKLRRGSRRSKNSAKSETSEQSQGNISSRDISIILEDDVQPFKPINYREELTFLFFNYMLEHFLVDSRELLIHEFAKDFHVFRSCLNTIIEKDFKDVQDGDLANYSVVAVHASKMVMEKSRIKTQSMLFDKKRDMSRENLRNKSSLFPKKGKSSKRNSFKEGSFNTLDGSKNNSRRTTLESMEELQWVLKVEDKTEEIIFRNGNRYNGQTSRNLMHGKGSFYWADGTVYEGEFKDGYAHGAGQVILPDLSIYEGDFFRGFYHGRGVLRMTATPGIYCGYWKHGKKHGKGWLLWEAKNWYDGEWSNDEKHGFGYRRYKNSARYKGMWARNKKNGEGSMIWENNDYYVGEWEEDKPHGYGEYTWNLYFHKSFSFPYYNWYKGSWFEGVRTGAGIMDFGANSGAKLAGIWENNLKHGPGVMICGNGVTMQRNPLFENDKPVHMKASKECVEEEDGLSELSIFQEEKEENLEDKVVILEQDSYRQILKEINSKVALQKFDSDILTTITKSGINISATKFVSLEDEQIPEVSEKWCPLEVPIHTVTERVDLTHYIDLIVNYYFEHLDDCRLNQNFEYIDMNIKPDNDTSKDNREYVKKSEEILLRHLITAYLPQLIELYDQYATIAKDDETPFKPVLIRLFFWQLLRDIGLPRQGISLVETDLFLADNPSSCFETSQYPFEPIYFWQFLQALLGCSWLSFLSTNQNFKSLINGIIAQLFKQFLDYTVFPNAGKFCGCALTEYKDLLPIRTVYDFYLKLGEPLSVHDFLYHTCVKKGKNPPCYAAIKDDDNSKSIRNGSNAVMLGHKLMYLQVKEYVTPATPAPEENPDIFYRSLYTFRSLKKKKIISCIAKICPSVITPEATLDKQYKLNFLEFYEILLQCAYEKADRKRRFEEKRKREEYIQFLKETEPPPDDKGKKAKNKPKK